jgi:hypothetical protein
LDAEKLELGVAVGVNEKVEVILTVGETVGDTEGVTEGNGSEKETPLGTSI